jgi:hypothetical protein
MLEKYGAYPKLYVESDLFLSYVELQQSVGFVVWTTCLVGGSFSETGEDVKSQIESKLFTFQIARVC